MRAVLFLSLALALPISGCYDWKATDHPVSGIKISDPAATEDVAGKDYTFSGSIVANGVDSIEYAFQYKPNAWESYSAPGYAPFESSGKVHVDNSASTYSGTLSLPATTLPGRYLFYSLVKDGAGHWSDTNKTYRRIIAPTLFPALTNTNYTLPTSTVPEVVRFAVIGQSIVTTSTATDPNGLDKVEFYLLHLLDNGRADSTLVGSKDLKGTPTVPDTGIFPIPANAVRTQRYRLEVRYYNTLGNSYSWQPLFQVK